MQTGTRRWLWTSTDTVDDQTASSRRLSQRVDMSEHRQPLPPIPITTEGADALGWSRSARRHAVLHGRLAALSRGVLAPSTSPSPRTSNLRLAQAASLTCKRAAISHLSAAIAHGLPTLGVPERSCLTVPSGTALRRLADVHLHRAAIPDTDLRLVDGFRVLAPARTVLDVAREFGPRSGVVAADHALRTELISRSELAQAFEQCAAWPGRRNARITLLAADGAAESPLESVSRLQIDAAGLPAPSLQTEFCDEDGVFLGRCDFYWDEFGVVGEADGGLKYDGRFAAPSEAIREEKRREADLERTGLIVVRWGWRDLWPFTSVATRLRYAFGRGAGPHSRNRRWGFPLHPPRSLGAP